MRGVCALNINELRRGEHTGKLQDEPMDGCCAAAYNCSASSPPNLIMDIYLK